MWDYDKLGNEIAMKMMLINGIREPTLTQIQENSDENVCADENFSAPPAWLFYSEPHPGLPEHYHTVNFYNNNFGSTKNENESDLQLPQLPFSLVNRQVKYKLLISLQPIEPNIPILEKLVNGSIIITSNNCSIPIDNETEIFLKLREKLLPCCFTDTMDDIIIDSPLTSGCRARCYYLTVPSVVNEVTFMDSNGKVIYRCEYREIWLHGSTSYHEILKADEADV